jgi:hypothetical protein
VGVSHEDELMKDLYKHGSALQIAICFGTAETVLMLAKVFN